MGATVILFILVAGSLLPSTEGVRCYNCADCDGEQGLILDCSSFSSSSSCYLSKTTSTGEINKSCGVERLDELGFPVGCRTQGDITICRCNGNLCNENRLVSSSSSNTALSAGSSNTRSAFYCYECLQCGSSLGTLVNCATFTSSRTCYSQKDPSGDVIKTCGTSTIDALNIPVGCREANGYYTCKCLESRCNDYRDTPTRTTTTSSAIALINRGQPPQRGINCYFCADCGSSFGVIFDCARVFQSTSCYALKEPSGEITRTCGTEELDEIGVDYGCATTSSGYTLCRCDTNNCNKYPEL